MYSNSSFLRYYNCIFCKGFLRCTSNPGFLQSSNPTAMKLLTAFFFLLIFFSLGSSTFKQHREGQISNLGKEISLNNPGLVKIPIESSRWYILAPAHLGIAALFNGITNESIHTGYAEFQQQYECIYPLDEGEAMTIQQIKMFDFTGSFEDTPAEIYALTTTGKKIPLATFTGNKYNLWVGPNPKTNVEGSAKFNLASPAADIRYICIRCTRNNLPTEIEFYGTYTNSPYRQPPLKEWNAPFRNALGMNGFEWDFVNPAVNSRKIAEEKYAAIKNFSGFRHYLDWERIEDREGKYTFNPCHYGGWDFDMMYERCKRDSIEVLACIKNLPKWMMKTYPVGLGKVDNAPLKFGSSRQEPSSYSALSKAVFQYAARYGSNNAVPVSLIKVDTKARWNGDPANTIKRGLGYVKYMECGNEMDKWWRGAEGFMNCYDYTVLLSAFYDGHKGSLGPDAGVKKADPNMQVVIGGLAFSDPSYVRGMIEWCRQHRGLRLDGTVDICWDVINYHHYSNDAAQSQSGSSVRGAAPELGGASTTAANFVNFSNKYANGMPVWITELGFDLNQGSPQKAVSIGGQSIEQTQANWILRSALVDLREGISRIFFYELKDFNISSSTKFASMGLTDSLHNRKLAMDYLYQVNGLIGKYHFKKTLQQSPAVDEYENKGAKVFAVWMPDEKGNTKPVTLSFPVAKSVVIYTPQKASDQLKMTTAPVVNGTVIITATETPVFVAEKK